MGNRDLQVIIPVKAHRLKETRELCRTMEEFPRAAWNFANQIAALLQSEEVATPEYCSALAALLNGLLVEAENAETARLALEPIVYGAFIHDPEGRKNLGGLN